MKRFLYITLALSCLFPGCKNALEEEAFSQFYTKDFYSDASEGEAAITSVYGGLFNLYSSGAVLFAPEWSADQMFPRNVVARGTLTNFQYDAAYSAQNGFGRVNESPQEIWVQGYRAIERANWAIARLPSTPMDQVRKNNALGEAYFLRAFFHWTLTKNFGNIVVKTEPTKTIDAAFEGITPIKAVYQQIYKDLAMAEDLLPEYAPTIPRGVVFKETAKLLHAKAALYDENWALALQKAKEVLNSGKFSLVMPYADIFDASNAKKNAARQEVLFGVEMLVANINNRWSQIHYFAAPFNDPSYNKGPAGAMYVYQSFYDTFNPVDKRQELLATTLRNASGTVIPQANIDTRLQTRNLVVLGKYKDPNALGAVGGNTIMILRLADAYLIAAEAEFRLRGATTDAYQFINAVRRRAQIPELTTGLSLDVILQERAWEFFGEGDRWYDLTRTNKFLLVIPTVTNADYPVRAPQAKHKYFPIPQLEVLANPKLEQNPDWR